MKPATLSWVAAWTGVLALFSQAAPAQDPPAAPSLRVWELPAHADLQPAGLTARQGWKALSLAPAKGPWAGGLAIESQSLLAVFPVGGDGVLLLPKSESKAAMVPQRLALLDDSRHTAKLSGIALTACDDGEATVGWSHGGAAALLKIGLGRCFVEVAPARGAFALQVRGPARFSFLPDFFGNDVLYDAAETAAARVFPPAENFLINLVEGHAALTMMTWPKGGGEEVVLLPEGQGNERRFAATQVSFNGKSVFVGVLAGEGIWFGHDLRTARKDATFVVEGWTPPFPAQWKTILVKRPAPGAAAGLASETLPLPALGPEGDAPYSDVYYHPRVPSWLTGSQWRLHLQTSLTHMMTGRKIVSPEFLLAINYPRDRTKQTPLTALTVVDVMRQTLGAGPCEYILDIEGLNKTRSTGAAGTGKPTAGATCSERGALVYYYLGERAESPRRQDPLLSTDEALVSVEKIKDFLDAAHARIQEYLAWSDELVALAERARAGQPQARELADRILPIAREMRGLWNTMIEHDKPCAHPEEWRMALDHCKDIILEGAPGLGERIREFDPQMRGAGEEVDGGMQACRLIVKRIRQEAALAGSEDPAALKLAAEIRQRCRAVLVNKHYKEGDSVRLSE